MKTPSKITPDCLKDTIVEIRLLSNLPRELVPGFALNILAPLGFVYTPMSGQNASGINVSLGPNQQVAVGVGSGGGGFFNKDKVRIQLIDNHIIFNCVEDNYIGWDSYFQIITTVMEKLFEKQLIRSFNRVSIRYISEFKEIEILKNIKGTLDFENIGLNLENAILRLVDESQNMKTFVTLTNKGKRISPQINQIIEASLVDINVFENFEFSSDIDLLKKKLNHVHSKQKETFFALISESFLKTLNPEY